MFTFAEKQLFEQQAAQARQQARVLKSSIATVERIQASERFAPALTATGSYNDSGVRAKGTHTADPSSPRNPAGNGTSFVTTVFCAGVSAWTVLVFVTILISAFG
jgi:hypothetical protein